MARISYLADLVSPISSQISDHSRMAVEFKKGELVFEPKAGKK